MADWGAFAQEFGQAGSQAYHGAQDYRFKVAQVAYENSLRQRETDLREQESALAQHAQDIANKTAEEKLQRAEQLEKDIDEYVNLEHPKPSGADVTAGVKRGEKTNLMGLADKRKRERLWTKIGLHAQGKFMPTDEELKLQHGLMQSQITRNEAAALADINVKTASPNRQIEYMIYMGQLRAKRDAGNIEPWEEQTLKAMETKLNKEDAMDILIRALFGGVGLGGKNPSPMPGGGGNDDIDPSTGRPWGE